MASVQIWYWDTGHLGMAVQTQAGLKSYITMYPHIDDGGKKNSDYELSDLIEKRGFAPSMPEELRLMGGVGGYSDNPLRLNRHAEIRGMGLRRGQRVVKEVQDVYQADNAEMQPVGRRIQVRPARGSSRMSLVLAAGQIYKPPTEMVEIPALTANQLGIDTEKIFHWWKSYAGKLAMQSKLSGVRRDDWNARNRYKTVSGYLNCCGTVYLALRVGGATYFRGRSHKRLYATPEGVLEWGKEVKTAIEDLNRAGATTKARYESKRAEFERKIGRNQQRQRDDLPTLEEWKGISYVGVMARRKDQIADMDRELQVYHHLSWENAVNIERKSRALCNIMRAAEEHARLKPMSDRSHAVSYLISKAWEVLERRLAVNANEQGFRNQPRDERNMYNSLAFTDAEFHQLFMQDEWIVIPDVSLETVDDETFEDLRRMRLQAQGSVAS